MADTILDEGTHSTAMAQDGVSAMPADEVAKDKEAKELEDAHEHADPSKGDKDADGGGRVKTDDKSAGAADEQATKFEQSI